MKITEAATLKKGDFVVITRSPRYEGLVMEVTSTEPKYEVHCYRVDLKQPGFDSFCINNYDTRHLQRLES